MSEEGITYSLNLEGLHDEWVRYDNAQELIKAIESNKTAYTNISGFKRSYRMIAGAYNSNDIPGLHLEFPSYASFKKNIMGTIGQHQNYANTQVSMVAAMKITNASVSIWMHHKNNTNLNSSNNWGEEEE